MSTTPAGAVERAPTSAAAASPYPSEPDRASGPTATGGHVTVDDPAVEAAFQRTLDEGRLRLGRSWPSLISTGLVGGVDVGTGVLAMLVVEAKTGDKLLAGLAFSIGFIALTLARSELFTEDFMVPVGTVLARQAPLRRLARLWSVTAAANLAAGWLFTLFVVTGFSAVAKPAVDAGAYYVDLGLGWRAFSLAILGGAVITLMTWMQHSTESTMAKIVPAVSTGFLLAGLQLNHAIVNSLLIFSGLHTGHAPYGYLQWAETAGWAALGNIVGGIGLVTVLRMLQVPNKVRAHVRNPASCVADS